MISLRLILLILALVLFVCSALGVPSSRVNLQSAGLALWVLAILIGGAP